MGNTKHLSPHNKNITMATQTDEWNNLSAGQQERVETFANYAFPSSWDNWKYMGEVTQQCLAKDGIDEPLQLLGKFLLMRKDVDEFANFLNSLSYKGSKIQRARVIGLELLQWCHTHKMLLSD